MNLNIFWPDLLVFLGSITGVRSYLDSSLDGIQLQTLQHI
jgi:hypothetical protein